MTEYITKDSGERAQFESGMQRDTEAGKPRFDLMIPLDVPYEDQFFTRVAALLGRGAVKYDDRNWEKANSEAELARMKSSAYRHFMQWLCGETDEDHAAATVFNLLAYETIRYKIDHAEPEAEFGFEYAIVSLNPETGTTSDVGIGIGDLSEIPVEDLRM